MTEGSALDQLADLVGIQSDYLDAWGTRRQVPEETKRRILAALGFPVEDPAALKQDVEARLGNRRDRLVPPVLVLRDTEHSRSLAFASAESHRRALHWQLNCEDGRIHRGRAAAAESGPADKNWIAIELPPDLPTGYHDLEIRTAEGRSLGTSRLIVAPARCWRPAELEGDGRLWGISAQLYSVRSARNWGLGDLTDLAALFRGAARCGAGAVGINPLHALFPERPDHASPYSPSSRLFLNPLYLDVEAIEDYRDSALARRLVDSPAFRNKLTAARRAERIDYRAVATLKLEVLEILYQSFRERCLENPEHPRTAEFRDFCGAGGDSLRLYCLFHALLEHFRAQGSDGSWRSWPTDYRDPRSPAVACFAAEHEERIEFQAYLQWQTDLQLRRAGGTARRLGLPVGLYGDLAVGADPGGAEAWANQDLFVPDVSVGAPPDPWNLKGQNWGSPPMNPEKLANAAYQPFVEVLRANMRHAGALRIDHVLGLMRLFWIPAGLGPDSGAYVRYPWRDLIAIVALESVRNRCLVVGEDLGTLPEGLREALAEAGILSYRLLYFEKDSENRFRPPDAYEREAVVSVTTHDLPTIAGYWHGRDLRLRSRLDLWPSDEMRRDEQRNRARDKNALISALAEEDLAQDGAVPEAPPTDEIHAFLARTPSRLLLVQLEDILGSLEQMNLPGTVDEHPNWRRKLPRDLATTLNHPALTRLARRIGAIRGARPWPGWDPDPVADEARRAPPDVPAATYRVQLSRDVTFDDAARLVTYLARLGVTHLYASPWLKARAGSTHGYDITDHNEINPEIGDPDAFEHLTQVLGARGMGQILDFVPNHMGIGQADNAWWLDVLEWGPSSPYADYFEIDWRTTQRRLRNKVVLPVLGEPYGAVLESGALALRFEAASGTFSVWYHEHRFPIAPCDYGALIEAALAEQDSPEKSGNGVARRVARLARAFSRLPRRPGRDRREAARRRARELQGRLAAVALGEPEAGALLERAAALTAGTPARPRSFTTLHRLLERQAYRLANWRVAVHEINYRRFFDINDLAGIRIENPEVFASVHRLVGRLLTEGRLNGARIDHIDGLFDPKGYLESLRTFAPPGEPDRGPYVVVEKILARHEHLRENWSVAGTTGYETLNQLTGVLVDPSGERPLTRAYHRFIGREVDFDELLYDCKSMVIATLLASELQVLARGLVRISERHWRTRDYTLEGLREALAEIVARFPVYRTYVDAAGADTDDRRDITWAIAQVRKHWLGPGREVLDFIERVLTTDLVQKPRSGYRRDEVVRFAMRFQQYTGPVMAKGLEDTAFYRYHRLAALNEVGGDPRQFGLSPAAFHHLSQERARRWPHGLVATATHDTKRGEDLRARLAALSELPGDWSRRVRRWATLNRNKKIEVDGQAAPGRNDEYLLYQTLLGAWPAQFDGTIETGPPLETLVARLQAYMTKAVREAKRNSSWANPNEDYEAALSRFVEGILDPARSRPFLADFLPFQARVARLGVRNSLSQLVLKLMGPGVPDLYQGTEFWDLSLVDPDNRRTPDYARRAEMLTRLEPLLGRDADARSAAVSALLEAWQDGAVKFYVTLALLRLRAARQALFRDGGYQPLEPAGMHGQRVLAFLRRHEDDAVLIAVSRHTAALAPGESIRVPPAAWGDTVIPQPEDPRRRWREVLTGRSLSGETDTIPVARLFDSLPVAVLVPENSS